MEKENLEWCDLAKGIGIFHVVFAHSFLDEYMETYILVGRAYKIIYSFHMSLFFLIAGMLCRYHITKYRNQAYSALIGKKMKQLYVPYLLYSLMIQCVIFTLERVPRVAEILHGKGYHTEFSFSALISLVACIDPMDKHIWFIFTLFFIYAITYRLIRYLPKKSYLVFSLVFYGIVSYFLEYKYRTRINYAKVDIFVRTVKFHLVYSMGYHMLPWVQKTIATGKEVSMILPFIVTILVSINDTIYRIIFVSTGYALLDKCFDFYMYFIGTGFVIGIASLIQKGKEHFVIDKLLVWIRKIGKNSFTIYLWHQPILVTGASMVCYKLHIPMVLSILLVTLFGIVGPLIGKNIYQSCLRIWKE